MKPTPLPLILFSLAGSLHAQENKPTGSEVVVTWSDQIYTIPIFNPTTAPRFGDNSPNNNPVTFTSSSLAPPATASITFTPITTPIPTPPPSTTNTSSSLAPPATSFSSFSAITSSISSFAGNGSATSSASSGRSSSSSAAASSSSAPAKNGGVRGGGEGVGVGVVLGGLVVALGVL